MSLWKWLGLGGPDTRGPEFDSLEAIETALVGVDRSRRRYVACFAYILARSARADHQVTEDESAAMTPDKSRPLARGLVGKIDSRRNGTGRTFDLLIAHARDGLAPPPCEREQSP